MSEDGTRFTIDLPVTGQAGVDAAAKSVDTLAVQLEKANKVSASAASAVAAGEAAYQKAQKNVEGLAKALEHSAVSAEMQRVKLQAAMNIGDEEGAAKAASGLRTLVAQESVLQTKATAAKTALDAQAAALDKLQIKANEAAEHEKKLQEQIDSKKPKHEEDHNDEGEEGGELKLSGLARGLHKFSGPLAETGAKVAELGEGWEKLTKSMGAAAPFAIAAAGFLIVVSAVAELTKKIVESIIEFGKWSVELADANAHARLLADGIARSTSGGAMLNEKIEDLTKTLPLTEEELSGMAKNLADSGLRGKELSEALDQAAIKAAKVKFGPDFAKEMLSLDEQSKIFHANLAETFGGLKTDALMQGLQKLVALFDSNTASGKALKTVFESIFQPLVDWLASLAPKIERFFLQLEILAMKALIAIKPYGSVIVKIGEAFLIAAAIIVGVVAVALAVLAAAILVPFAAWTALVLAIMWGVGEIEKGWAAISAFFKKLNVADLGRSLIDGLINGIKSGATAVINAMKGVVTGAIDAAKKALGIASPSKVFAEIGLHTSAGMELGVQRGTGRVRGALEMMVAPPPGKPGSPSAQAPRPDSSSNRGGHNFSGAQFVFNGVKDGQDAVAQFEELLTRGIEGDVTKLGGSQPSTATT